MCIVVGPTFTAVQNNVDLAFGVFIAAILWCLVRSIRLTVDCLRVFQSGHEPHSAWVRPLRWCGASLR